MIALKMMSDFPHLGFIDYTTGRFGALIAVGKRTYQAGPANLLPVPADITLTLSADFNSLVWEEKTRKSTAKRIAFAEIRTNFHSGSNLLGGMLISPTGKGPFMPQICPDVMHRLTSVLALLLHTRLWKRLRLESQQGDSNDEFKQ